MPFPLVYLGTMPPELWLLLAVVVVSAIVRILSPECTAPSASEPTADAALESAKPLIPQPPPSVSIESAEHESAEHETAAHETAAHESAVHESTVHESSAQNSNEEVTKTPEENLLGHELVATENNMESLQVPVTNEILFTKESHEKDELGFSADESLFNTSQAERCELVPYLLHVLNVSNFRFYSSSHPVIL